MKVCEWGSQPGYGRRKYMAAVVPRDTNYDVTQLKSCPSLVWTLLREEKISIRMNGRLTQVRDKIDHTEEMNL